MVAAHPAAPVPGSAWEFGFADVDALEVWNGRWNLDDELSLRIWQRLLREGRRVVAVGGSDSHAQRQSVGSPQTVVHARRAVDRPRSWTGCAAAAPTSWDPATSRAN